MRNLLLVLLAAVCTFGCRGNDDGVKPEHRQALSDANSLAKKVDGDYDKLSDSEKQVILKMANGNEEQARTLTKFMAHPPNEAIKSGRPGGGAPPPAGP